MGRRRFAKDAESVRNFKLVSRSQYDSHGDREETPLVLEPFVKPGETRRTGMTQEELLTIPETLKNVEGNVFVDIHAEPDYDRINAQNVAEDDGEFEVDEEDLDGDCYFPKDGYNYEQHLRTVTRTNKAGSSSTDKPKPSGGAGIVLEAPNQEELPPPKAFEIQEATTEVEKEIMAALDDDEAYEELADEDIDMLLPGGSTVPEELLLWGPKGLEDKDAPDLALLKQNYAKYMQDMRGDGFEGMFDEDLDFDGDAFGGKEAVANEDDFAAFLDDEYNDDELGACEEEEIIEPTHITSANRVEEVLDMYIKNSEDDRAKLRSLNEPQEGRKDHVPRVIGETKAIIANFYAEQQEGGEIVEDSEEEEEKWDCETVLSTLSNLSNRPGKITRISKAIRKPESMLKPVKEDESTEETDDESDEDSVVELPDVILERKKGETNEEKKARKQSVKEMRKICRKMKKESKETFKAEATKLNAKTTGTGDIRTKLRTLKIN